MTFLWTESPSSPVAIRDHVIILQDFIEDGQLQQPS